METKRFYLFALGCKVNGYENNTLREKFFEKGYTEASSPKEADVIVLNTCSVTSKADQKSRQHIRKFATLAPNAILVSMGCWSEAHQEEAISMGASIALGTSKRNTVVDLVEEYASNGRKIVIPSPKRRNLVYEGGSLISYSDQSRAYLKVQDGCDNFCAYCLIPSLRGNSRSRLPLEAREEAKFLVGKGYKEILVTGIHIGNYGKDLGDGSYRLSSLVKDILDDNPSLPRLRLGSIEESEIDEALISLLKERPILASHLHIPLQSGSESVLKRMKRHYDASSFLATLDKLREARPDIAITTDIIAGFPGESEEEWKETLDFARKARFAEIHVFPFSSRKGTLADSLPNQIDPRIKERRVHELLALSSSLRNEYEKSFYGKELEVIFESFDKEKQMAYGHSSNYLLLKKPSDHSLHSEIGNIVYDEASKAD